MIQLSSIVVQDMSQSLRHLVVPVEETTIMVRTATQEQAVRPLQLSAQLLGLARRRFEGFKI